MINVRKYVLYGWLGMATFAVAISSIVAILPEGGKTLGGTGHGALVRGGCCGQRAPVVASRAWTMCRMAGPLSMSNHRSHLDTPC